MTINRRKTLAIGAAAVAAPYLNSAFAQAKEIKLGQTMPYSGPLSIHGIQGRTEVAYFRMLNEEKGGINGRKINLISLDDAFSPPKTMEAARRHGTVISYDLNYRESLW